jgi:hypothetical protein
MRLRRPRVRMYVQGQDKGEFECHQTAYKGRKSRFPNGSCGNPKLQELLVVTSTQGGFRLQRLQGENDGGVRATEHR